ncbi:coiled-coil domain-containing protein 87-like isoform X1 [Biomphalaria pfeifferi]|uniref:Coiled-coil domain-containing protein 87-like isoform X1 n=1 Tax=Biomphalaria pfeifferi TaxID=112525 RepID=A0AAD8BSZ9_BIOPF|nr:coiled-coil domain-containing protein 87-like isoform X1 [Biomphalaria pfeifferi]
MIIIYLISWSSDRQNKIKMPSLPRTQFQNSSESYLEQFATNTNMNSKPEKVDNLYPFARMEFNDSADIQKRMEKVLGPLSLFAPFSNEDVPVTQQIQLKRPVTPINDEIKSQPTSLEKLTLYVTRRIRPKENIPYLSLEDQKVLGAIIVGEVNVLWPEIKQQIDDPFLTPEENKELHRRITVHIVTVCEQLFQHYLNKAQVLNSRGVFSGPANMSRLKTQLALEAGELLDILKIHRYIKNDIRGGVKQDSQTDAAASLPFHSAPQSNKKLTYQSMLELSRPKSTVQVTTLSSLDQALQEIQEGMPVLDTSKLHTFLSEIPEREIETPSDDDKNQRSYLSSGGNSQLSGVSKEADSKQKIMFRQSNEKETTAVNSFMNNVTNLRRCRSQPNIILSDSLLEELGINKNVKSDPLINHELEILLRQRKIQSKHNIVEPKEQQLEDRQLIVEDLNNLLHEKESDLPEDEDDLPPLIQVIIRNAKHDDLKERTQKKMKELEEKQKQREEEECVYVHGPLYPQPDTVNAKLGKSGIVRTSDIRVSERVCMSSITLQQYPPVYNDLFEEIDPDMVKKMDKNLFLSSEIQEVYEEIMKTVPTTHLELDDMSDKDPFVLNGPETINLAGITASSTLTKKIVDRVINPAFKKKKGPPWGKTDMKDWAKTPDIPPKNFLGEDLFSPLVPNLPQIHDVIENPNQTTHMVMSHDGKPSLVADKTSATYASWLHWWKSTVTSDDYVKYLSTLETDYLGAIFHFYDSEEESDTDEEDLPYKMKRMKKLLHSKSGKSKLLPEQKEKVQKLNELKSLKTEYQKGFWNANSVLMGGLGKDPEIDDIVTDKEETAAQDKSNLLSTQNENRNIFSHISKGKTATSNNDANSTVSEKKAPPPAQDRLENVWQKLYVPDSQRLDMAIKYSCNGYFNQLSEAIEGWEYVADLILRREKLLVDLEKFERHASDPNRFFHKDSKKSSYRLKESKQRAAIYKKIDDLDSELKEEISYIQSKFHDVITFKGRPYLDKLKWDRTEMLYWLAEERKQNGIKYETYLKSVTCPVKPVHLQPISVEKT